MLFFVWFQGRLIVITNTHISINLFMEQLHKYGIEKFSWYKTWHEKPLVNIVHFTILLACASILINLNTSLVLETKEMGLNGDDLGAKVVGSRGGRRFENKAVSLNNYSNLPETKQILVKFKKGARKERKDRMKSEERIRGVRNISQLGVEVFEVGVGETAPEVIDRIKAKYKDDIEFVEENKILTEHYMPNDQSLSGQWQHAMMRNPLAWDNTKGQGAIVAVLDSGIDSTHPDLTANIIPGYNMYDLNTNTTDIHGHGTWVSGTAAAVGDNTVGIAGSAYGAKILPIRIAYVNGQGKTETTWDLVSWGIVYAADHGARVVNLSYGPACDAYSVIDAARYLRSKGGVLVVSAGNTQAYSPAYNSGELTCVGSTNSGDTRSYFSTYGPSVDVTAPGEGIYTTGVNGGYVNVQGTSFAAPNVAAVYAMMFSANPNLTPSQADNILFSTAKDLGVPGWDEWYGYGRVDTKNAVDQAILLGGGSPTPAPDTQAPSVPVGFNGTTTAGVQQVMLSWQAATDNVGVTGYNVYRNGTKITTVNALTYTDTAIQYGTAYTYTVSAVDAAGNTSAQTGVIQVTALPLIPPADTQAPTVPGSLNGTANSETQVSLSWQAATDNVGVTGYNVYRNGIKLGSVTTLSYTDSTAVANTAYSYTVSAYDAVGNTSAQSTAKNVVTPDATAPTVPASLTSVAITHEQVVLSWQAATDNVAVIGYNVYRNGAKIGTASTLSYTDLAVTPSTGYLYTVSAYDAAGNTSAQSAAITVTTSAPPVVPDTQAPTVPANTAAVANTETKVTVSWAASTDNVGVTGYNVYRNGTKIGTVSTLSYVDTTVSAKTTYSYTVSAFDASDNASSQSSTASVTTPDTTAPSLTSGVTAVADSETKVTLSWQAATDNIGVTGYNVYRNGTKIGTASTLSYADTTVVGSTLYLYTISAYDAAGNTSAQSGATSVTTPTPVPPPDTAAPSVPTGIIGTANSQTQIALSWQAATDNVGVTGYNVYRNGTKISSVSALSYIDTGLSAGTAYTYTVSAYDLAGNTSVQSAGQSVTTQSPVPPPPPPVPVADTIKPSVPAGLTAVANTATQVALTWIASTDNVGVTGYNVYRNGTKIGTVTTLSYTDSTAKTNTTYSYTVAAFDAVGNFSAKSPSVSVKTPSVAVNFVQTPYVGTKTANSVVVNWGTDKAASGVVKYGTSWFNMTSTASAATPALSQAVPITGLLPNRRYYYQVTVTDPATGALRKSSLMIFSTNK